MTTLKEKGSSLTGTRFKYLLFLVIILLVAACSSPDKGKVPVGESFGKIIYDTYVINRDSTDSWGDECLSGFNRNVFIDKVFKAAFEGRITTVDYFTGEKITPAQISKMESDGVFSRKNISKIQFEEQWLWNDEKNELQKKIISMTIAYEVFDLEGKSRGQKPIFKLIFTK